MRSARRALIVFVRYPEAGKVKSRLSVAIGVDEAARVYQWLVGRTLHIADRLKKIEPEVQIFLFFDPPDKEAQIKRAYPGPWKLIPQTGTHLGMRMDNAIKDILSRSFEHVLLIGTDIADLSVDDLIHGFEALDQGFAALGPAADGGFYIVGLDKPCPKAFEPEAWGTSQVFDRTERLLLASGFRVRRLNERKDIDKVEDLQSLEIGEKPADSLSVIIPTLSDPESLLPLLTSIEACLRPGDEVIVVDGGSGDECSAGSLTRNASLTPPSSPQRWKSREAHISCIPALAGMKKNGMKRTLGRAPGVLSPLTRCISSPRGRGLQLNLGVAAAKGNILLFLHDDSIPPADFPAAVRLLSEDPHVSLGCFELAFHPSTRSLDLISRWANLRTRILGLPYGDQGLFCRRDVFEKTGGFQKVFLMEDVDFVKRCRKWGTLAIVPKKLYTSPRRYFENGILRTSLRNHFIMLLYQLGVEDGKLYSLYYGKW